jgi:phage/plasmid-like protein (TIGR03299 family)
MHAFETGFFAQRRAWHGLGTVLEQAPSVADALRLAGLDWEVQELELAASGPNFMDLPIPDHKALVRSTDGSVLGVVGSNYTVVQNADLLANFEQPVADGLLRLESAGSLKEGRRVWILGRYGDPVEVNGSDAVLPYLLIATGHDGTMGVAVANTPIRVVCWNTLSAAVGAESWSETARTGVIRIAHTAGALARVKAATDAVIEARAAFDRSMTAYRGFARTAITEAGVREMARTVFDRELVAARETLRKLQTTRAQRSEMMRVDQREEVATMIADLEKTLADWKPGRTEDKVVAAYREAPGAKEAGETVWGAVNAITYYIDHDRPGDASKRMASSWFGAGATQRRRAFEIASELVTV